MMPVRTVTYLELNYIMKTQACLAFTALAIALTGAPATAATFSYDITDANTWKEKAGDLTELTTTFNDTTNAFTWSSTFSKNATDTLPDGGWLVVNNGPEPSASKTETIIFYMDGLNNQVSAYDYDGSQKGQTWKTSDLLGTEALEVTDSGDDRTLSFSWDLSNIHSQTDTYGEDWTGAAFGDTVGIWLHGVGGLETEYAADGSLSNFKYAGAQKTAFDIKSQTTALLSDDSNNTKDIPEPGMVMALGMTAAAAAFTKRRKAYA